MKPLPLLILFANFKGNLGDFAIFQAILESLESRYPGRERHVFSLGHKEVDEHRLACFLAAPHPPFIFMGKSPYHRVRGIPRGFRRSWLVKWWAGRSIDRLAREFGRFEPISKVAGYEAVCLAGGEQWGGFSTGINQFAILEAISRINREVFIYPFSVKKDLLAGYFRDRLEGLFARIAGARVVRDSGSGETIRVICPEVVVGADCVFSLTPSEPISRCGALAETTVVLAVTEAKNSSRQELEATICGLTAARMRVRLLTTCECEDGEYLAELSRNLGVDFIAPATWQEAVQEFKAASVVVTNRLHCMVFSFFAGVPVVPLRNREKVAGICRDAGLTSWVDCIAEFTPEKAIECIETGAATLAKMSAYRERVRKLPMEPWQVTPASD